MRESLASLQQTTEGLLRQDLISNEQSQEALRPIDALLPSVDETIRKAIETAKARLIDPINFPPYNHRLFNRLLEDVMSLLERCDTYRREAETLSEKAIAATYQILSSQSKRTILSVHKQKNLSALLDEFSWANVLADLPAQIQSAPSTPPDLLSGIAGLSEISRSANLALASDFSMVEATLEADAILRQRDPESVTNYAARYRRSLDLLESHFTDAYERLYYFQSGIVFMKLLPDSWFEANPLPSGKLQEFIGWVNEASSFLDRLSMRDTLVECIVPFGDSATSIVPDHVFFSLREDGNGRNFFSMPFKLGHANLPSGASTRIRSITLDCLVAPDEYTATCEFPVQLKLPDQAMPGGDFQAIPKQPIIMRSVKHARGGATTQRLSFLNASPVGDWVLDVSRGFAVAGGIDNIVIKTILLRMELLVRPEA